ncbi:unnamed protein product [Mucor hiemalis]
MVEVNQHKDQSSILSQDSSTLKSVWNRLSHLFHSPEDSSRRLSTSSSESDSSTATSSTSSTPTGRRNKIAHRKRKVMSCEFSNDVVSSGSKLVIPPYSPTYCKANEFPYSNFYVKLPNGKWMVRYRSGNRDILGTDEFEGYMI